MSKQELKDAIDNLDIDRVTVRPDGKVTIDDPKIHAAVTKLGAKSPGTAGALWLNVVC